LSSMSARHSSNSVSSAGWMSDDRNARRDEPDLDSKDKMKNYKAAPLGSAAATATAAPQNLGLRRGGAPAAPPPKAMPESEAFAGDVLSDSSDGGVVGGVTPVALAMPGYDHVVSMQTDLVTRERPFRARLVYFTDAATYPLWGAWAACVLL